MSGLEPIVVLGSGGHAKVVIDMLQSTGEWEIVGCLSAAPRGSVLGVRALGGDDMLSHLMQSGVRSAFVAIGDNRLRQKLANIVQTLGFQLPNAISPRAIVSRHVRFGNGSRLCRAHDA